MTRDQGAGSAAQRAAETGTGPNAEALVDEAQRVAVVVGAVGADDAAPAERVPRGLQARPACPVGAMTEAMAPVPRSGLSRDPGVILATKLGAVQRPSRTYPAGRMCATRGCETRLSIYNADRHCSIHELAHPDDASDAGRAA